MVSARLEATIERLYVVFGERGLPEVMDYCSYCDRPEDEQVLHGPLRTLTPSVIGGYAFNAMHHTGSEEDFKHFVPRILELLADDQLWPDTELVLGRLDSAGWRQWPHVQQAAVDEFLDALWDDRLDRFEPHLWATPVLIGQIAAGRDTEPLLRAWEANDRLPARLHLARTIVQDPSWVRAADPIADHIYLAYQGDFEARLAVSRWLASAVVLGLLESAVALATTAADRDLIDAAITVHRANADPNGPPRGAGFGLEWLHLTDFVNRKSVEAQATLEALQTPYPVGDFARVTVPLAGFLETATTNVLRTRWPKAAVPLVQAFGSAAEDLANDLRAVADQTRSTYPEWQERFVRHRGEAQACANRVRAALGLPTPDLL